MAIRLLARFITVILLSAGVIALSGCSGPELFKKLTGAGSQAEYYDQFLTMASCDPHDPYRSHIMAKGKDGVLHRSNVSFDVPAESQFVHDCIELGKAQGIEPDPGAHPHKMRKGGKVRW